MKASKYWSGAVTLAAWLFVEPTAASYAQNARGLDAQGRLLAATTVTITVLSRDGKPVERAAVRLSYPPDQVKQASTSKGGVAMFELPVDASLASLEVLHADYLPWRCPSVFWRYDGTNASVAATLDAPGEIPIRVFVWQCDGGLRPHCERATGSISVETSHSRSDAVILKGVAAGRFLVDRSGTRVVLSISGKTIRISEPDWAADSEGLTLTVIDMEGRR